MNRVPSAEQPSPVALLAVLFEAGSLAQAKLPRWLLARDGTATLASEDDSPLSYGEEIADAFTGPQTRLR